MTRSPGRQIRIFHRFCEHLSSKEWAQGRFGSDVHTDHKPILKVAGELEKVECVGSWSDLTSKSVSLSGRPSPGATLPNTRAFDSCRCAAPLCQPSVRQIELLIH
jgi:hypothetical protein